MLAGKLDNVAPGEPEVSETDLASFLHGDKAPPPVTQAQRRRSIRRTTSRRAIGIADPPSGCVARPLQPGTSTEET